MALRSFRRKTVRSDAAAVAPPPAPPRWPIDPELSGRIVETRRRIEDTRRRLGRHVLPARKEGREGG